MNDSLLHFGVPGMRWGIRRDLRGYTNQVKARLGIGTLHPTYQYKDSHDNIVTRYGPGKYGGGPKPTSKGDSKFYKTANKQLNAIQKKKKNNKKNQ